MLKAKSRKTIISFVIAFMVVTTMTPIAVGDSVVHAVSNWETEDNGTSEKADAITVNNTYYGNISKEYYDSDYYWFTTPTAGTIQLTFNHDYISNPNNYWSIELFDENGDMTQYSYIKGNSTSTTLTKLGVPAGTYYIGISDSSLWSGTTYNFKVAFTATSAWETESNDSSYSADTIKIGKRVYGNIYEKYENDYYWFHLSRRTKVNFNFRHNMVKSPENCWSIRISDENWNMDKYYYAKGNKTSSTYNLGYLPAGDYFIKVTNSSIWSKATYSLMVYKNNKPNSTRITSISAGKKKISLKWKKSSDATGYEIYRATAKNGKYKKIKTIKSRNTLKYTNIKLKKGKRYYYKMRAYKTVSGKKYYSGYCNVKWTRAK